MIRILTVSIILISGIFAEEISIGSKMPGADYFLKNIDGKESTLSAFKKENGEISPIPPINMIRKLIIQQNNL